MVVQIQRPPGASECSGGWEPAWRHTGRQPVLAPVQGMLSPCTCEWDNMCYGKGGQSSGWQKSAKEWGGRQLP